MPAHSKIYDRSLDYDIAFDYRDVGKECDFLAEVAGRFAGRGPGSFLELAAGPAAHAIEFASRGLKASALDVSPGMVAYGTAKAGARGVSLEYLCGDMTRVTVPHRHDLAALLLDSASYLLDNDAVYRHLRCVAGSLADGGLYVLEMKHPRDVLTADMSTKNDWEMARGGRKVHFRWGTPDDSFDPITQISQVTVSVRVTEDGVEREYMEIAPQRSFTCTEFKALIDASLCFRLEAMFGALDTTVPFDNDRKAWRMVAVLQRL